MLDDPGDSKTARCLQLIHLIDSRSYTARQLASELKVSERTVMRYLAEIEANRLAPIDHDRKGYRLAGRAALPSFNFTPRELLAILVSSRFVQSGSSHLRKAMESVVEKVRQGLGERHLPMVERLKDRVAVDLPEISDQAGEVLLTVTQALIDRKRVEIVYQPLDHDTPSSRQVDPWGIFYHGQAWYFTGYDHLRQERRTFRSSRVHSISLLDQGAQAEPFVAEDVVYHPWDPPQSGSSRKHARPVRVVLQLTPEVARWVAEDPVHPSQSLQMEQGHPILLLSVREPLKLVPWVAGLQGVRVLRPGSLRHAVAEQARKLLAAHLDPPATPGLLRRQASRGITEVSR